MFYLYSFFVRSSDEFQRKVVTKWYFSRKELIL